MGSDCTPTLAMVAVQVAFAGLNILSKLALDSGMSAFVLIAYRQLIAAIFLSPFAYFFERRTRMKITRGVLFQIFLCSLFGATINQLTYFVGLKYSSPTIACALGNTLPAITFIMAVPFRMETVGITSRAGQAKVAGTVLCVGGSMLMTFYKGSLVKIMSSHIHWQYAEDMASSHAATTGSSSGGGGGKALLGATFVIASCFAYAVWFIIQAKMSKYFSSPYTSSAIMSWMAAVQCFVFGFAVERKVSSWALGFDIRLYTVLYIGLIGSGFAVSLMAWSLEKRGPLFVSMFSPLLLVIVAVVGWAILDEKLYLGTAIGSAVIVGGLYLVLWGKGREMKEMTNSAVGTCKSVQGSNVGNGGESSIGLPVYFSPSAHEGIINGGKK